MRIKLLRLTANDKQVLGNLFVYDRFIRLFECVTLEPANRIPAGRYPVTKYQSPKFGFTVLLLHDVPGREAIEIHAGNFFTDSTGCILPGEKHTDINKDGYIDVTFSKATLGKLIDLLPDEGTTIDIYESP